MSSLHWSPNLSVGVEALDSDHRELIDLMNELDGEIGRKGGHDAIMGRLDALIARTETHFRREEAMMAEAGYPEAEHHARLHEALMGEIWELREIHASGTDIGPEIADFIKRWLVSHIMESDKHLGGYLEGRGEA